MEEMMNNERDLKLKHLLRVKSDGLLRNCEIKSGFSNLSSRKSMSLA
jgi:hypothetical protein